MPKFKRSFAPTSLRPLPAIHPFSPPLQTEEGHHCTHTNSSKRLPSMVPSPNLPWASVLLKLVLVTVKNYVKFMLTVWVFPLCVCVCVWKRGPFWFIHQLFDMLHAWRIHQFSGIYPVIWEIWSLKEPLPSCVTSLIPRDVWFNRMKVKSLTLLPNRHLILHSKQASGRSPQTASLNRNSTSEMERWITSWCKILQNYTNLPNKKHGILQKPIPFLLIFFLIGVYFFLKSELRLPRTSNLPSRLAGNDPSTAHLMDRLILQGFMFEGEDKFAHRSTPKEQVRT